MPRNISVASLAKLATRLGTEPINIIEIEWVDGTRSAYSDRDIAGGILGRIQEVSGLDDVVQVSGGSQSQQISITLDDTDGSIKGIMDSHDIHKRPCWVYQWFDGIATSEKFLIFKGVLNTPIQWNEGDRTIKFDVVSKIEDVEVGFSIEEGDFINPPEELIGKPWPLCFGTVTNVPALRCTTTRRGILASGTGIHDFTLNRRIQAAQQIVCPSNFAGYQAQTEPSAAGGAWGAGSLTITAVYQIDQGCIKAKCEALESLQLQLSEQLAYEYSPVTIFGGSKFPQGVLLTLNINGGKFQGRFSGDTFTITGRLHPDNDGRGNVIQTTYQNAIKSTCGTNAPDATDLEAQLAPNGIEGQTATINAANSKASWDKLNNIPAASFFWANAGSTVAIDSDEAILYIANLLPSTILRVAAYRELNGGRQLLTVPSSYYTIRQTNYTGYTGVMEILFTRPLSTRDQANGGGWSDDIYVTMTSSVGPNTVDILEWFIGTYTQYGVDATSFNAVRTQIDNYPMHFALLERKNIINVLEEIAYQARCALWLKDDVFYIKYLSIEPDVDDTISEDDVMPNTLRIEHTPTEDLVTKYVAEWTKDYAAEKPNTVILRNNVKIYGTHEFKYDFYCFNILDLVRKSATFWLIRKANTWRRAIFQTPMNKLTLETFDTVGLTLPDVGPGTIKCVVEKANYNSDTHTMDFEIWTPCKSGTNVPYDFAWPADISETLLFPTLEERSLGLAGSGHEPNFSVIAPNAHPLSNDASGLFQGFSLACNGDTVEGSLANGQCRADHGDKHPSDINDTKPVPDAKADSTGEISGGSSPISGGSSACCQEALNKANQAMAEAQQARKEAAEAADAAGQGTPKEKSEDEAKQDLPSGKCGGNCTAVIEIQYIFPTTCVKPPGSEPFFTEEEGDSGRLAIGTPANTECFTFNSQAAANQFATAKRAEIQARTDGYSWVVGQKQTWLVFNTADLGIDEDPDSPNFGQPCSEPGGEDQAMVGYQEESTGVE